MNLPSKEHIINIIDDIDKQQIKRLINDLLDNGKLVDLTGNRKRKTLVLTDSQWAFLTPWTKQYIEKRLTGKEGDAIHIQD